MIELCFNKVRVTFPASFIQYSSNESKLHNITGSKISIKNINTYIEEASFENIVCEEIIIPSDQFIVENFEDKITFLKGSNVCLKTKNIYIDILKGRDVQFLSEWLGEEQRYIPLILLIRNLTILNNYSIENQLDYQGLKSKVSRLRCGVFEGEDFTIIKPISYFLDEEKYSYSFLEGCILKAERVRMENVEIYSLYYEFQMGQAKCGGSKMPFHREIKVKATGSIPTRKAIMHFWKSFAIGRGTLCHPIYEASAHILYLNAERIIAERVTIR